jgi:multidrug efflux pump subunit AcrB
VEKKWAIALAILIAALFLGALSSPFLLIVLIPLAILWLFVAMTRRTKTS